MVIHALLQDILLDYLISSFDMLRWGWIIALFRRLQWTYIMYHRHWSRQCRARLQPYIHQIPFCPPTLTCYRNIAHSAITPTPVDAGTMVRLEGVKSGIMSKVWMDVTPGMSRKSGPVLGPCLLVSAAHGGYAMKCCSVCVQCFHVSRKLLQAHCWYQWLIFAIVPGLWDIFIMSCHHSTWHAGYNVIMLVSVCV